ncbi:NAD(P)/FAD-dependent oxidoreductase [Actinophytocola sp.]|uniref:NAD(P)/FAD-dependent oxidoreductase n=1 Tax=Actinophytocola sp. TaxID=1872138 RepID=UPI003D6A6A49
MTTDLSADLAIIGGGIIGCFVAHQAAHARPDRRVVLLERSTIGAGATAWSAGVSFPLAATAPHRRLVRDAATAFARLRDTTAGRFLRPMRMIYVVGRAGRDAFHGRVVDAELRVVTEDERGRVERMLPGVRLGADEELLTHDGYGFAVDARGLAEWLVSEGVTVHSGQNVTGIHPEAGGYRLVGDRATWSAGRAIVATGAWPVPGPRSDGPAVRTKRVAALHADLPTEPGDPLVYFLDDDLFFLPSATGPTLVSFYRDIWDLDPASMDGRASEDDLRCGTDAVRRRSPAAAEAVTAGRAFCDGYAPDRLPVVTAHPDHPGLVSIRGGSGSGVRLAPALAAAALRTAGDPTPSNRSSDTAPAAGRR